MTSFTAASWSIPATRGAGITGRPPGRSYPRIAAAIAAAILTVTIPAVRAAPPRSAGGSLRLHGGAPRMDPVTASVRLARVAVVPGSKDGEAWGIGFSFARKPGFDQIQILGQVVFARYTRATGWQVYGPPLDADGRPFNPALGGLALTPDGEGWAVGDVGQVFHHEPGGPWQIDTAASALTPNALHSISIHVDSTGVHGFAVGDSLTFLRLEGKRWSLDVANGAAPLPGDVVPQLVSVTALDVTQGWAVAVADSVMLWRRNAQGWQRQVTGKTMFDATPAPLLASGGTGTIIQNARAMAVSAAGDDVWIGGVMQAVDVTRPVGDSNAPDPTRPFTLHYDISADEFTSYCPRIYQLASSGVTSTVDVCDRPFPYVYGELPMIASFEDGRAIAGGFGLYEFAEGAWTAATNSAGFIVSGSFTSPSEGWVASSGNVFSGLGFASSSTTTIGHWTTAERRVRMRRWPVVETEPLAAIAEDPGGSGRVMAVGRHGAIVAYTPRVGWDAMPGGGTADLRGLAWPPGGRAWAVGLRGVILEFDGARWRPNAASGKLTTKHLNAVAFQRPDLGWAVGDDGTILSFAGGSWAVDPASGKAAAGTTKRLNAVVVAGAEVVAAGDSGTVLVRGDGGWARQPKLEEELRSGESGTAPNLLSAAGFPDGSAYIGGARSVLLYRQPGRPFEAAAAPALEGSIHTLAAARDRDGRPTLLAAVGDGSARYTESSLATAVGTPFALERGGWRELGAARAAASDAWFDAPAQRDAVYAFAVEREGRRAWAAGGIPPEVIDADGHIRRFPSASVWQVDLDRSPPRATGEVDAPASVAADSVGFAFLGDSACVTTICSAVAGSGARGDVVLLSALQAIEEAAAHGAVRFVAIGGDMRRHGLPDELAPMRALLDDLSVPSFAAVGDKDLFASVTSSIVPQIGDQQGGLVPSAGYYLRTFRDRPQPWGHGSVVPGIDPVSSAGDGPVREEEARSHYAFDVRDEGRRVLRVVFLDTSYAPLAGNAVNQNPAGDQISWLESMLAGARSAGLPAVVVMHQPLVLPASTGSDAATLTSVLSSGGALAVLASHDRLNRLLVSPSQGAPGAFHVGVFGGAGSVLGADAMLERGAYHSWQLVTVRTGARGAAAISVRSIPVLESVALGAPEGRHTAAGRTLHFRGLGRLPDVGFAHVQNGEADPAQSRATYLPFPLTPRCELLQQPASGRCTGADVATPDHQFSCEDASVCRFVREDPRRPGLPLRTDRGELIADATSGLMCALRPGKTFVRLEAGFVGARVPVTVGGGSGPCIPGAIVEPSAALTLQPPAHEPEPAPEEAQPRPPKPKVPEPATVAALAPPLIQPVPAPPSGGAAQREEEREAATEQAEMTALPVGRAGYPAAEAAATAGMVAALALLLAGATRARVRRAIVPALAASAPAHPPDAGGGGARASGPHMPTPTNATTASKTPQTGVACRAKGTKARRAGERPGTGR